MLLLVGLGNPGRDHEGNRHNIGFMAVDEIVRRHGFAPYRARFQSLAAEGTIAGKRLLALKPQTFMNRAGAAVALAARYHRIAPARVIVIHDELDLVPGKVRVKQGGGAAGHNGLRSLDEHIGPDYWRVRVGIGHPGDRAKVESYVLRDFPKADRPFVRRMVEAIAELFPLLVEGNESDFMSKLAAALRAGWGETPRRPPRPAAPAGHGPDDGL